MIGISRPGGSSSRSPVGRVCVICARRHCVRQEPNPVTPDDDARALPKVFPEFRAGGYSRVDGNVAFFLRVQSLLRPDMTVVDYGAGRGEWIESPITKPIHLKLRVLRGQVAKVIGVDVDPIVVENASLDEALVVEPGQSIPLPDGSVDLIVSDHTLEHLDDPDHFSAEVTRLLKPGGWLCARTPNSKGYIAMGARMVPNKFHQATLRKLQPNRPSMDVFPTRYRLNSPKALKNYFPVSDWDHVVFTHNSEPSYFAESVPAWRVGAVVARVMPLSLGATLHIFLQKR